MKRAYLTLIVLMLVVGFAAVATNLAINGTINFGFNQNDFDSNVVFSYADSKTGSASINDDEKTIIFETMKLENVNQQSILVFDVANKSIQYDADVTIECGLEKDSKKYEEYLTIANSLEDKFELKSGATKTGYLTITLIKAFNESLTQNVDMVCSLVVTPKERDTKGTYTPKEHQYEEILLKGADPVLEGTPVEEIALAAETNEKKLIPVKIGNNGTVTRADTTKEWYNYEKKEWANAVILVDGAEEPGIEEEIPEEQIESYFVWIPKYRYKIWSIDTTLPIQTSPFAIEIEFGIEDTSDSNPGECTSPNKSGDNGECDVGDWMTHPAFVAFPESKGIWVGKFETGYNQNTTNSNTIEINDSWNRTGAQHDDQLPEKVIIKPNVYSWTYLSIENAYRNGFGYQRELDSHMMKNTEWGAVAYLTSSIYGRCTKTSCTEININNNSNYKTGWSSTTIGEVASPTSGYQYGNDNCVKASTTENYSGVFDMSGGISDKVIGFKKSSLSEYSKFIGNEMSAYYDIYDDELETNYRILGDATSETYNWYHDYTYFGNSLFIRGGHLSNKEQSGIFSFYSHDGTPDINDGFRIVLAPQ